LLLSEVGTDLGLSYLIHPALLDACFQVLAATVSGKDSRVTEGDTYLPVGLGSLRLGHRPRADSEWWSYALLRRGETAGSFEGDVFLLDEHGQVLLEALGFRFQRLAPGSPRAIQQHVSDWLYEIQWQTKSHPQRDPDSDSVRPEQPGAWLIFSDRRGVGPALRSRLEAQGEHCISIFPGKTYKKRGPRQYQLDPARPQDFQQLLQDAFGAHQPRCRGIVHLWSLDAPRQEEITVASLEAAQVFGCVSTLHLVQAVANVSWSKPPRLWLVTRRAQGVSAKGEFVSVAQSPVWGLGRVIAHEHPELHSTMVDLGSSDASEEIQSLFHELWSDDAEEQIALRGDERLVARLVRCSADIRSPISNLRSPIADNGHRTASNEQPGCPFRLEVTTPGMLDNLVLRATSRQKPGSGAIEIEVCAAGLNFSDVMKALGIYPGLFDGPIPLGIECAGRVAALGEGVEGFQLGDEVIAIAPYPASCFGAFVTVPTAFVLPKSPHLRFEEAATVPIAFGTAYYALYHLARLADSERVLIHAAAGGVGLAAVQLAQRVGAEVFGTAGTPEKREFLQSLGVKHVMDSRSLTFAEEVMERTGGQGVDVVLNSLAGEAISKSLSTLKPFGRFIEIGKRDIYQNRQLGLRPFQNNLSFFAVDMDQMIRERPALVQTLMREVIRYFEAGQLNPLPLQLFPISDAVSAFRIMAQARHIGKIVLSLQDQEVAVAPPAETPLTLCSDSTYLITGGLGGLGLSVAQWMVQRGARHLVLMGRSGAPVEAGKVLDAMKQAGAEVRIITADVAQEEQIANVIAEIRQSMPPLKGIIHAAGILDDGILLQLNQERFKSVMAPKMSGAWNLHAQTLDTPLDFFVLFSSAASVFGSPGQGNYAAANAFLDALAHYRRALGLPALTINWGPWAEVGLAARPDRSQRLVRQGMVPFTPQQGVQVLERLLQLEAPQVMTVSVDWSRLLNSFPSGRQPALLSQLAEEATKFATQSHTKRDRDGLTREALLAVAPDQRQAMLESYLQEQVAKVLGLAPARLDRQRPLITLGLDSLMAVELKNRLEVNLSVVLPVATLLQGPSVTELAAELLKQVTDASDAAELEKIGHKLEELETLSEEQAAAMLEERKVFAKEKGGDD
jgi:NADPH:quinone reductase-like Zn-dependent oxidoreductase/aryl carrier-like protein